MPLLRGTALFLLLLAAAAAAAPPVYLWLNGRSPWDTVAGRLAPPRGYVRIAVEPGSFAEWLRGLPLKLNGSPVRLHTGELKPN
ncbi:MAG: hypothetical protein C4524_01335 [Candidatus Zixiibacteriota bacterium]|nr:MAG: hypothetical protein C4524_01335 [candidate division Zixibacteria bacterium]